MYLALFFHLLSRATHSKHEPVECRVIPDPVRKSKRASVSSRQTGFFSDKISPVHRTPSTYLASREATATASRWRRRPKRSPIFEELVGNNRTHGYNIKFVFAFHPTEASKEHRFNTVLSISYANGMYDGFNLDLELNKC